MSLSTSLESIVSRIVKKEPVSIAELQGAGRALLSKEAKGKSKGGIATKIQNVIRSQAHNMELRRSGLAVTGKLPFRFIKKRPDLKAKLNAVILKALVKKEEESKKDKPVADKDKSESADKSKLATASEKDKPVVPEEKKDRPVLKEREKEDEKIEADPKEEGGSDPEISDSSATYTCGDRTFKAKNVEKKCSYYGMEEYDCDDEVNKAYKELLALRKSDIDEERARLTETVKKSDKIFKKRPVDRSRWGGRVREDKELEVSLGHAMEIHQKFKEKYYTLIHGESAEFTLMHLVAKKLEQVVGKNFWEGNYVFRHDCFRRKVRSGALRYEDQFWSQPLSDFKIASKFFRAGLSRDGVSLSTGFLQTIVKDVFSSEVSSSVLEKLQELDKAASSCIKGLGSFCVLCVPKDKILDCLPFTSGRKKFSLELLDSVGKERIIILPIDKMTPKNGMLSFHESACLTMDQTEKINNCVHEIINAAIKGEDLDKVAIPAF